MRFAVPTILGAIAAAAIGITIASLHWAFVWIALAMVGAVLALGGAVLLLSMVWPQSDRGAVGHPVGL